MLDKSGHIIHIDFGFILGISPGHNLGFEVSPFKLSQEMIEVMGGRDSEIYRRFTVLTIQAFLATRLVMEPILSIVSAYADADLPCFQYKSYVLQRLRQRFMPQLSDVAAGQMMLQLIDKARRDWTGVAYDGVQKLQNNIYSAEWK